MQRLLAGEEGEETVVSRNLEPVRLAAILHEVPGKWVAIQNGEIIEARDTLDALVTSIHYHDLGEVTVIRSPAETEAEMVGLG